MRRIFLGAQCNNACVFCAQGDLRSQPEQRARGDVSQAIARAEPGETVALVGGEPTVFEALPQWIQALDARGVMRIVVQTNGRRLAYPSYTEALKAASSKLFLEVSLHGSSAAMHDYHTNVPGSFQQTVLGLRNARKAGILCGVSTVVTRSNFRHLREILALSHSLGARAQSFAQAIAVGRADGARDRVVPAPELVKPYWAQALLEAKRLKMGTVLFDEEDRRELFAGLGVSEADAAGERSEARESSGEAHTNTKRRVSLAVLNRPAPGRQEVRKSERRSGEALRALFPALFEGENAGEERTG